MGFAKQRWSFSDNIQAEERPLRLSIAALEKESDDGNRPAGSALPQSPRSEQRCAH